MNATTDTKRRKRGGRQTGIRAVTPPQPDSSAATRSPLSPAKVTHRSYAFINHKGGVGKTSAATHCAGAFAELGYRVLLIDCDSQGNLSSVFLPGHEAREWCVAHLFTEQEANPRELIAETAYDNIWIMPSDSRLNLVDQTHGFETDERVFALRGAIREVQSDFDLILLDGSPSPHLSSYAAMVCADEILVPCEPSVFSLEGLPSIQAEVASVRERFNPNVRVRYFLSRTRRRGTTAENCRVAMCDRLGAEAVFTASIPDLATYNSAVNAGRHVIAHARNSRASDYIRHFADELLAPTDGSTSGSEA